VEKETHDRIKDLVSPDAVSGARLVLTNAIYFKGDWTTPFKEAMTKEGDFSTGEKQVKAKLMHNTAHFGYKDVQRKGGEPSYQALEMPYAGKDLSMLVLLPNEGELAQLEAALSPKMIAELVGKMPSPEVRVTFPKFKMEDEFELSKSLQAVGVVDAFDRARANFSGISSKEGLYISAALHKAFVEVNEKGTEAAAATALVMKATAMMPTEPIVFNADHPFIFVLCDRGSGAILFMGRVTDPTK
jgi:serpin B